MDHQRRLPSQGVDFGPVVANTTYFPERETTMAFRASLAYGPNKHTQRVTLRFENFESPAKAWDHLRKLVDEALTEPDPVYGGRAELLTLQHRMSKRLKRGHVEAFNLEARVY